MSTESRQPKGIPAGGQFAATTHTEPSLSLAAARPDPEVTPTKPGRPYELTDNGDGTFNYSDVGAETTLEHKEPVTRTDIRRALRCPRGQGRVVDLGRVPGRRNSPRDDIYEVVGPESGAPLVIRIQDGFHAIHVTSGNVQVEVLGGFMSTAGRTVVEDGARAGVVVDDDHRYTIETRGSGSARVALSTQSNVDVRATGTGQMYVTGGGRRCEILAKDGVVVHQDGPEEDRLPVQRPAIWW
ncbi:hypothetical protein IV500_05265 [Paeniglutamicibacter antarcticus]|uniref:Uncharacterized protein n=1 Tax=Arthrobacter terrae TaxID=2935737 RepID=A0A931CNX0_9MICC|nr:hypothetical protein [Arthrobacter terrae]MBG0738829.1 hypothetical protein [Arthrobacter terrae]